MVMRRQIRPARVLLPEAARRACAAWLGAEQGRFVLFLPVFMGAGVLLYFGRASEPPLVPACIMCAGCFVGASLARHALPRALLLCAGFAAAGFASAAIATWRAPPWAKLPRTATMVSGTVAAVDMLPDGRRVTLTAPSFDGGAALPRQVRIRLRDSDAQPVRTGDTLQVRALLQPPPAPAYPGGWDLQRDAFFAGMAGYGFAIGDSVRVHAAPAGRWQAWREAVASRIMKALPGARGAIAATLLTGLATAIPASDRQAFQDAGLAHLLAVAGLHIGIVTGLFFALVRTGLAVCEYTALHWPTKRMAAVAALAAGAGYMALTGAHVPILRSFAMASLVTLAVLTGRRALSMRALALAAVALMSLAPQSVVGVSFQMSFAAVLALVAGYEAARPVLAAWRNGAWWRSFLTYACTLAFTSFLAGTACLPFAAYHFGKATLYYVPANMLAVPLTAFWVMPCCMLGLLLMPFGWERAGLVPAGWGIDGLLRIAHGVAAWPGAMVAVAQPPGWGLCLVGLGMAWVGLFVSRLRVAGLVPLLAGLMSPLLVRAPDILVGPDAAYVAVRSGGAVLVELGKRAGLFAQEAPERVWGKPGAPFPAADCDAGGCLVSIRGRSVVLVRDASRGACAGAAIVVSTGRLGTGCAAGRVIDGPTARVSGAVALFVHADGTAEVTDREWRGQRLWVYAVRPRLPPAETE
jgi:competence protein ComEC